MSAKKKKPKMDTRSVSGNKVVSWDLASKHTPDTTEFSGLTKKIHDVFRQQLDDQFRTILVEELKSRSKLEDAPVRAHLHSTRLLTLSLDPSHAISGFRFVGQVVADLSLPLPPQPTINFEIEVEFHGLILVFQLKHLRIPYETSESSDFYGMASGWRNYVARRGEPEIEFEFVGARAR